MVVILSIAKNLRDVSLSLNMTCSRMIRLQEIL
mgnify:CR=1 FL=1